MNKLYHVPIQIHTVVVANDELEAAELALDEYQTSGADECFTYDAPITCAKEIKTHKDIPWYWEDFYPRGSAGLTTRRYLEENKPKENDDDSSVVWW